MACFGGCCGWLWSLTSDQAEGRSPTSDEIKRSIDLLLADVPGTSNQLTRYTFEQLTEAAANIRSNNFLGEGAFGKVYKGRLMWKNQIKDVAIKQLNADTVQGNGEFVIERFALNVADHPNFVKLFGTFCEDNQRMLVYEFMPLGSVHKLLFVLGDDKEPLDWNRRMKIATGVAAGLEYLHDKMDPPIIYRNLNSSNILLDEDYHPKLSDVGFAKQGPEGGKDHVSTSVMGNPGYTAPECVKSGQLTFRSDMYCFGVFLFELITGRRALDSSKPPSNEGLLVNWVKPFVREGNYSQLADPALNGLYPEEGLQRAINTAYLCVQKDPRNRLLAGDVKKVLDSIAKNEYDPQNPQDQNPQDPQDQNPQDPQDTPNPEAQE